MRNLIRFIPIFLFVLANSGAAHTQTLPDDSSQRIEEMKARYRRVLGEYFQGEDLERVIDERVRKREANRAMRSAEITKAAVGNGRLMSTAASVEDSLALVAFYHATDGPNWKNSNNWLTGPVETWAGVNLYKGRVEEIWLDNNNIGGQIPPEIGNLTYLTDLVLFGNRISGKLPKEMGLINHIHFLYICRNNFTGQIPVEITHSRFWILDLGNNHFSGSIPPRLRSSDVLDISSNQLTGPIPPEFVVQNARINVSFKLNDNRISGRIPIEFMEMEFVYDIHLSNNRLSGPIPPEIGQMASLGGLLLNNNLLSGHIPPELANMTSLGALELGDNRLSGQIPRELGNMENLRWIKLNGNALNGSIPEGLLDLDKLLDNKSDFRYNALYSEDVSVREFINAKQIDGNWEDSQTLKPIDVRAVALSPTEIEITWSPVDYMEDPGSYGIYISESFDGPFDLFGTVDGKESWTFTIDGLIPATEYFFRVQSRTFPHDFNQNVVYSNMSEKVSAVTLADHIPTALERDSLALVALYHSTTGPRWRNKENWLVGPLDSWYGVRVTDGRVTELRLEGNRLYGPIPPEIGDLDALQVMCLDGNMLKKAIPEEMGLLSNLIQLDLSDNYLTKHIPTVLGGLNELIVLDLGNNRLSGEIPPELGSLSNLERIDLAGNGLNGTIPEDFLGLASLSDDTSDFRYNALFSENPAIIEFIDQKQVGGNWQDGQTLAVVDVQAVALSSSTVEVSWSPVAYLADPGCYAVVVSEDFEGPYVRIGTTETKEDSSLVVTDLAPDTEYFFRVSTRTFPHDDNKNVVYSNLSERVSAVTMGAGLVMAGSESEDGVEKMTSDLLNATSRQVPEVFSLMQNYPNPFNAETVFAYTLPEAAEVRLAVFDMQGRVMAMLQSGWQEAGAYEATWHAADAPSGTYFVRFEAGGFAQMRKCVLMK